MYTENASHFGHHENPERIGPYRAVGPVGLRVPVQSLLPEEGGSRHPNKEINVWIPYQAYTHESVGRSPSNVHDVLLLMAGYGGVGLARYFKGLVDSVRNQKQVPQTLALGGLPGYWPHPEAIATLVEHPSILGIEHYPAWLAAVVRQTLQTVVDVDPNASQINMEILAHSGAVWALPSVRSGLDQRSFSGTDLLTPLYREFQERAQAQGQKLRIFSQLMAVAPCGRLQPPLSFLQAIFPILYNLAESGIPPHGNWAKKIALSAIHAAQLPHEWKERAHLWAELAHAYTLAHTPRWLHEMGDPLLPANVLQLTVGGDRIAATHFGQNDGSSRVVIGGKHSNPDSTYLAELIGKIFAQMHEYGTTLS